MKGTDARDSWSNVFQEPYPEELVKEEAEMSAESDKHNVKQAKPRKESKVKTPVPKPKEEMVKEPEEQLPGQDSILNHPEYLPDGMKEDRMEVLTGEVVDCSDITEDENKVQKSEEPQKDNVQQDFEGMKIEHFAPVQDTGTEHVVNGMKKVLRATADTLLVLAEKEDWAMVISKATAIVHQAKRILEVEEKN